MTTLDKLIWLDIKVMGLLGGKELETISSAAWQSHITGRFWGFSYLFIDLLFYCFQRNHCRKDWEFRKHIYS